MAPRALPAAVVLLSLLCGAAFAAGGFNSDGRYDDLKRSNPDEYEKKKASYESGAGSKDSLKGDLSDIKKIDATKGMSDQERQQYEQDKRDSAGGPSAAPLPVQDAATTPNDAQAPGSNPAASGGGASRGSQRSGRAAAAPVGAAPVSAGQGPETEAGRQGDRAFSRASSAAAALRSQFRSAQDLGAGGPGGGQAGASPSGASASAAAPLPARTPPSMANPKTPQDLALASVSGFGGSFAVLGLKMGSGPGGAPSVLHGDGTPASGREVDDLRSLIASEPTALMHRPDYFSVLSRPRFQDLRTGYATRPALAGTAFKDVGMPPDRRDFLWSASCARLSGDCNKAAGEESYKKGDYVPPEDLNRIWQGIQSTETDADAYTDEDIKNANAEDQRIAALSHSVFKNGQGAGLLSRLSGLFNGGIGSFFNSAAQGSRTAVAGTSVGAAGAGPDEGTAAARAHGSAGARRGETAVPEAEPVLASAGTPAGRLAAVLGLLSAAALAARLLKRRQAGEP